MSSPFELKHQQDLPAAPHTSSPIDCAAYEQILAVACLALLALAALGPSATQSSHFHDFADQRTLLHIPNMADVVSNLAFAAFGLLGLVAAWKASDTAVGPTPRKLAGLFFFGMVVTALCSAWYHLHPDDGGLAIDRFGMTFAFGGMIGLAVSNRVSQRAGLCITLAVLVCGAWSIQVWSASGNVLPWAVLQFGGIAVLLGSALLPHRADTMPISWGAVIAAYALAKFLEQSDAQVYHLTHEIVSGHTLKHIVASLAALPILAALQRAGRPLESPAHDASVSAKR